MRQASPIIILLTIWHKCPVLPEDRTCNYQLTMIILKNVTLFVSSIGAQDDALFLLYLNRGKSWYTSKYQMLAKVIWLPYCFLLNKNQEKRLDSTGLYDRSVTFSCVFSHYKMLRLNFERPKMQVKEGRKNISPLIIYLRG